MEMKTVKLGDLYSVSNGLSKGKAFFGSGYPFLTFSEVMNNFFVPETLTSLVQTDEKERSKFSIKRGDVFLNRTSETADELGVSCVALKDYPNATYNGFCKRLRPLSDEVVPEYMGYYLRCQEFRNHMLALTGNMITRASLRNEQLASIEIKLPPKETQEKIANILRQYDLLTENCKKQIVLLEEAAQRLLNELLLSTESEEKTLGSLLNFESGFAFKSSLFVETGKYRLVTIKNVKDGYFDDRRFNYLNELPERLPNHCMLCDGDVLLSLTGDVARCCISIGPNNLLNQRVAKVNSKYKAFAYYFLRSKKVHFTLCNIANGAAQQNLSPLRAEQLIFSIPKEKNLNRIENLLMPYMKSVVTENAILHKCKRQKELLLPRLISGQIKIEA